jgi:hypothetical protein
MRRFIVMNPNLSVGRQGDIVTADQLKMTDDKLDEWVAANHGIEIDQTPVELDGYVPGQFVKLESGSTHVMVGIDDEDDWGPEPWGATGDEV